MTKARLSLIAILAFAATPALAQNEAPAPLASPPVTSVSLTLTLESAGDIERRLVNYQCEDDTTLSVHYINAAPNFLAMVPVNGQNLVFASTISASGARYVAGPFEWWSHQGQATLRDLMQDEDAEPLVTCTEVSNTP